MFSNVHICCQLKNGESFSQRMAAVLRIKRCSFFCFGCKLFSNSVIALTAFSCSDSKTSAKCCLFFIFNCILFICTDATFIKNYTTCSCIQKRVRFTKVQHTCTCLQVHQTWLKGPPNMAYRCTNMAYRCSIHGLQVHQTWLTGAPNMAYRCTKHGLQVHQTWLTGAPNMWVAEPIAPGPD